MAVSGTHPSTSHLRMRSICLSTSSTCAGQYAHSFDMIDRVCECMSRMHLTARSHLLSAARESGGVERARAWARAWVLRRDSARRWVQ